MIFVFCIFFMLKVLILGLISGQKNTESAKTIRTDPSVHIPLNYNRSLVVIGTFAQGYDFRFLNPPIQVQTITRILKSENHACAFFYFFNPKMMFQHMFSDFPI
mgnify:CR=1 FL=1